MDGPAGAAAGALTREDEGYTPQLELEGYSGLLDRLLAPARNHTIDLSRLSLPGFAD